MEHTFVNFVLVKLVKWGTNKHTNPIFKFCTLYTLGHLPQPDSKPIIDTLDFNMEILSRFSLNFRKL